MPSILAIRALVGASLSIGVADIAALDLWAAPQALAPAAPSGFGLRAPGFGPETAAAPAPSPIPGAAPSIEHFAEQLPIAAPPVAEPPARVAEPPARVAEPPARVAVAASSDLKPEARSPKPPALAGAAGEREVYFAKLRSDLDDAARRRLAAVAALHPVAVAIEGHTDHRGGEALNLPLRRDRALAARAELVRLGVAAAAITVRVAPPSPEPADDTALWRDRRVELAVTLAPAQGDPTR